MNEKYRICITFNQNDWIYKINFCWSVVNGEKNMNNYGKYKILKMIHRWESKS